MPRMITKEKRWTGPFVRSIPPMPSCVRTGMQILKEKREISINQAVATPLGAAAMSSLSGPTCILLSSLPASFGLSDETCLLK